MKFTFKRNNKKRTAEPLNSKDSLLQKLDEANLRLQYKCARWLERKTAHLSRKSWIIILFCFTVFTCGCCIYVIVNSFSQSGGSCITITPITKPAAVEAKDEILKRNLLISKTEFERIIRFRKYMDSLGRSPTGKKLYDSIVQFRPGLLDSLTIIENYYYSHFKN
jgi:predicted PurR-regulated permease PerM